MIRISEIKLKLDEQETKLEEKIKKRLRLDKESVLEYRIYKKSLDARKKDQIHFTYIVDVTVKNEKKMLGRFAAKDITETPDMAYRLPKGKVTLPHRPIVVGFGPSGMFAGLLLAQMGLKPVVLERGQDIDNRTESVEKFWNGEGLNPESNVQFGEGGAGTFSDGKLTTRIKDLRCRKVLEELVLAGAPQEILYDNKPHIGTDKLKDVVKEIRNKIISLGGEVCFDSKVTDLEIVDGKITGVVVNDSQKLEAESVVLSIGHSARDTFELLHEKGVGLEQKPFAMGVRIEHPQKMINESQYGAAAEKLGAADYKLAWKAKNGRSVYSFCMCPGGEVVAASSEEGRLSINGMSEYARDGENANSAILVQVFPEDYGSKHPLAGIHFQRELEERAFRAGGENHAAPIQLVGDFLENKMSTALGEVKSTFRPNVVFANLEDCMPSYMTEALREAIPAMGKRIHGFDRPDAILTAVESRSSSPVRISRQDSGESVNVAGLYPVGEGAGYAGGIISAAVDGLLAAEQIFEKGR